MATFVELSGGRELVNEEKAEALVSQLPTEQVTHLRLSNKSFDNAAAARLAKYVDALDGVVVADISDIIAGRPEDEALRTLNIICNSLQKFNLVELNLSDNALGAKGVTACKSALGSPVLERLFVCNDGLAAEAAELLTSILLQEDVEVVENRKVPPLKLFHFYNNMAGDGGAKAVARLLTTCTDIEDFRFSATRTTKVGCADIAKAIATLASLRRLDLCDNNFSGATGALLVEAIRTKSKLEYLNLRDDSIAGTSDSEEQLSIFNAIVEAAAAGSPIAHLDLSGNEINAEAATQLARALEHLPALTALYLDDCELGSKGAKAIATALSDLPNLKTLSMCTCEITAAGAYHLARAVAQIPSFVNLELNGNLLTENGIDAIRSVLHNAGKVLGDLEDNDDDEDNDDIEDALSEFEAADAAKAEEEADNEEELLVEEFRVRASTIVSNS